MQNTFNKFDLKIRNFSSALDEIKSFVDKFDCPEFSIDLSSLNIIDAMKVLMLSSAYHYGRYPDGRIFCRCMSDEIISLIEGVAISNFELI